MTKTKPNRAYMSSPKGQGSSKLDETTVPVPARELIEVRSEKVE